ncbi:17428_t:CDS:10 [Racocetra fulgida]|uniref:17428_t:CDS:1 n=1 Tax=Racocetra fulgida TaxID=60492 RepID=A0A9N9ABM9_9GLOM|nr:17428_t:CDS:10 [Racocetra fulgida]
MSNQALFQLSTTLVGHEADVGTSYLLVYSLSNWLILCYSKIKAVCCPDGNSVVSSSRDKTARLWSRAGEKAFTENKIFLGHDNFVNSVAYLPPTADHPAGLVISGSSDKTINVFDIQNPQEPVYSLIGHSDNVCALDVTPSGFIASGSWDKYELYGHTSFVYSLGVLPTGEIISSGEDRSVKVWKDGECIQTIIHPATSVWCVASMPNGDIVSGSSDGIIRLFTRNSERVAESNILKVSLPQRIQNLKNQVGDLKKDKLPGLEALQKPGQVIMVRVGDIVEAHQWNQSDQSWHKIGEVVDAVDQGRKQLYKGREYDHVFDVDIGGGSPTLKLPFNTNDDPYQAAREFISANGLPEGFTEQIVDFILKNAPGATISSGSQYADPYTGPSPVTGSSSITSGPAGILPHKTYLKFDQANIQAILKKISQINGDLQQNESTNNAVLTSEEITTLENLAKFLQNPTNSGSNNDRQQEFIVIHQETNMMLGLRALANLFNVEEGKAIIKREASRIIDLIPNTWNKSTNKNLRIALVTVFLK